MDRLALVMPWGSKRPERCEIVPSGQTRQIWLDIDGHFLPAGAHRITLRVRALRIPAAEGALAADAVRPPGRELLIEPEDAAAKAGDMADLGIEEEDIALVLKPTREKMLACLKTLAAEEEKRNYYYQWIGENRSEKKRPHEASFAEAVAGEAKESIPEYVLWTPCAWINYAPTVLPPSLKSSTNVSAELCMDEREPVCLALSNISPNDLRFSLEFLPADAQPPERTDPMERRVEMTVAVWPLRLPQKARMEVYTYNYGASCPEHLAFLRDMKVNWFTAGNPKFTVADGELACDFAEMDATLDVVRQFGKVMYIYAALKEFTDELAKKYRLQRGDPQYEPMLRAYFTQWLRHMREKGWKPEDYAIELWDEPGQQGYYDHDWIFDLIVKTGRIMKETEPKVQIMVNPLMGFGQRQRKWLDSLSEVVTIFSPHGGTVYLKEDVSNRTWEDAKSLDPEASHWNSCFMMQMHLKEIRRKTGARRWTYYQHSADASRDPIGYFRHFPWKNKWNGFEGVSFWSSWYATAGCLDKPFYLGTAEWWLYAIKGMYGWREGVEDVQYIEMLEDAVDLLEEKGDPRARDLRNLLRSCQKRVADCGWWATDAVELEAAMKETRREIADALVQLGKKGG